MYKDYSVMKVFIKNVWDLYGILRSLISFRLLKSPSQSIWTSFVLHTSFKGKDVEMVFSSVLELLKSQSVHLRVSLWSVERPTFFFFLYVLSRVDVHTQTFCGRSSHVLFSIRIKTHILVRFKVEVNTWY